jgi:hypothetical protein
MRCLINVLVVVLVLVLAGGLALSALPKIRASAARTQCQNNLKQIGMALENSYDCYGSYPSATIPNENLPVEKRLSWLVAVAAFMEQEQAYVGIDHTKAWDHERNRVPATGTGLPGKFTPFHCPADPASAVPDPPGLTDYVGISGVGTDAASFTLDYPGTGDFGYERKTTQKDIKDGMASTIMVMETNSSNGPWTAGGFPTTRGLDPAGSPYLGASGQFGSGHRSCKGWFSPSSTVITNVVFADSSVRGLTDSVSPEVLEALVTIAGGEEVGPVGE